MRSRDRKTRQEGFTGLSMQSAVITEPAASKERLRDRETRQEGCNRGKHAVCSLKEPVAPICKIER
jgi:hypothetical protein